MTFLTRSLLFLTLFAMGASLSACGRRGALVTPDQAAAADKTKAVAAEDMPVKDRKFILDGLIGG